MSRRFGIVTLYKVPQLRGQVTPLACHCFIVYDSSFPQGYISYYIITIERNFLMSDFRQLIGKSAIVTGSGRGIGKAIATLFTQHGASVVINDIDSEVAEATAKEINDAGGSAVVCAGSVTDIEFPDRLVKTAADAFGGIDVLVNNAGYTWDSVIQNMSDEQWYAMLEVHLTAPFRIIRAATPYMREVAKKEIEEGKLVHRKIINISSTSGVAGNAGQVNYSAGKMGIVGVTKTMAKEWGRFNINVNAVAYGFIETRLTQAKEKQETIEREGKQVALGIPEAMRQISAKFIPLGRGGTPEEAAGPVLFLASPLSNYVSGAVILVTGASYV
jgi:3-oxoacyl-[acyl-carrier protein] reductase